MGCLKSASLSVCTFHNSLAGIFRREDPSRDKEILQSLVFFSIPLPPLPSFPLLSENRRREGYKQKTLKLLPLFVKYSYLSSRFRRATFDRLALRRSNSIMPLLRNKEKKCIKKRTGAREMWACLRITKRVEIRGSRGDKSPDAPISRVFAS